MVGLVVLQAAAEGAHVNAGGEHLKGCVRLNNACNLVSSSRSCEDACGGFAYLKIETTSKYFCYSTMEMQKIIMVVLVVLLAATGGALFNAGGEHPKGCVRLKNACNLASCNSSCKDTGGGICISKDVCCRWAWMRSWRAGWLQ
uniref:Uncharacterized protein n=1 Tax=Tanacetum cinerariifolium TaxID=118510 RepID=A0A699IZX3_TANCI|nr:hypothetical protein [Tanacetum cinerariifolium]